MASHHPYKISASAPGCNWKDCIRKDFLLCGSSCVISVLYWWETHVHKLFKLCCFHFVLHDVRESESTSLRLFLHCSPSMGFCKKKILQSEDSNVMSGNVARVFGSVLATLLRALVWLVFRMNFHVSAEFILPFSNPVAFVTLEFQQTFVHMNHFMLTQITFI